MHRMEITVGDILKFAEEEVVEESKITDFRQSLLPTIERMRENPALRVLIRKHGVPRAVLMSAATYDVLKGLVNRIVKQADAMSREDRIEAALQRLDAEAPTEAAESIAPMAYAASAGISPEKQGEAKVIISEIEEKLRELKELNTLAS